MKGKKTTVFLAAVLFTGVLSAFVGCRKGEDISKTARAEMSGRTKEAQFMPDAQTVMGEGAKAVQAMRYALAEKDLSTDDETAFDVFDMERLLSELAVIEGNGAGKYLGYEVDEIKTEMYNIVNRAPWTDEWFRVPRAQEGTDYYSNWAYLIENDLAYNFLAITRISWRTRASYYDSETGREIEDDDNGEEVLQYNVMRTEYYMEEDTEIVEVEMLDIAQVRGQDYFMAYQGLKNAEDKYFIKYNIEAKPRTRQGYVMDTETPYGANREFCYMTYGNSDFDLLQIEQRYPNAYRTAEFGQLPSGASIEFKSKKGGMYQNYALAYGYGADGMTPVASKSSGVAVDGAGKSIARFAKTLDCPLDEITRFEQAFAESLHAESALEILLNAVSKGLVDDAYLANNWNEIFQNSEKAAEKIEDEIDLPIKIKYRYADATEMVRGNLGDIEYYGNQAVLGLSVEGYLVPNPAFRNMTECNYYLAPALMNERGEIVFLPNDEAGTGNDFDPNFDIMWYGAWLETGRTLKPSDFTGVTAQGEYALVSVLRQKGQDGHLENIYLTKATYKQEFSFYNGETNYRFYAKDGYLRLLISGETAEKSV